MSSIASNLQLSIEQAAKGVVELANEHMVRALRVISLHRGCDPRDYVLVSFGGAGGLHVCALAEAMQMTRAIVPVHGGVLSALGMLVTPVSRQFSQTMTVALHKTNRDELQGHYKRLIDHGLDEMDQEGLEMADMTIRCSMDLRYVGQSYYLNVDFDPGDADLQVCQHAFNAQHLQVYGHSLTEPVELVNIRVAVSGPVPDVALQAHEQTTAAQPLREVELPATATRARVYRRMELAYRQKLKGPALVLEEVATTFIAPGWGCTCDAAGNLVLTRD
jgi:N-methylhydantoinase A